MSSPASILVTITLPTARVDGTPLTLAQIASVVLTKAVGSNPSAVVDTILTPATASVTFTDTAPDFGETDSYSVTVTDVEGNTSAPAVASVNVPASVLAAPAAASITAVFQPAVA